jgi:hypothetical protein
MCLPGVLNNTIRNTKEAIKTTIGASHNITTGAQVVGVVDSNTGEPAGEDYYNASQDLVIHQRRDPTDTSKEATYRQIAIVDPAANVMKPLYIGSDNGTDLSQASLDLEHNGRNVDGDDFAFRYKNEGLWIVNDGYNHISWKVGRRYQDLLSQADATSSAAGSSRWRRKKFHHNHRFHVIAANSSSIDGMMAVRLYAFKDAQTSTEHSMSVIPEAVMAIVWLNDSPVLGGQIVPNYWTGPDLAAGNILRGTMEMWFTQSGKTVLTMSAGIYNISGAIGVNIPLFTWIFPKYASDQLTYVYRLYVGVMRKDMSGYLTSTTRLSHFLGGEKPLFATI